MPIQAPPLRLKANPTLETLYAVERVLRQEYERRGLPMSYAELERRMPAKRVRFEVLQACVMELARHSLVAVGSDGIMWIVQDRAPKVRHVPLQ